MKEKCCLCQSQNLKIFLKTKERDLFECQDCGLVFVSRIPGKRKGIASSKEYYQLYLKAEKKWRSDFAEKLKKIKKIKIKGKLLDVGCALGFFLEEAKKAGFEVVGIDTSDYAVEYCRKRGLKEIFKGSLEKASFRPESFDVVIALHVLEHTPHPKKLLLEIKRVLKSNGLLLLGVPNSKSGIALILGKTWFGYHHPEHFCFFNQMTLNLLLEKTGFRITFWQKGGWQSFPLENIFNRLKFYYSRMRIGIKAMEKMAGILGIKSIRFPMGNLWLIAQKT